MPSPRARLGLLLGGLATLAVVVLLVAPVSERGLRSTLEPFGAAAPVVYVLVSGVLGSAFVPGPILAGASGLLFGTLLGFVVTLGATVLTTVLAVLAARGAGRAGVEELEHPRVRQLERMLHRRPVLAVIAQRLVPGIPDAPFSYLFGLAGLRLWQVVVGTVIGGAPRAFSYTAIGDGLGGGGTTIGVVGLVVLGATTVVGALVTLALARRGRQERRLPAHPEPGPGAERP